MSASNRWPAGFQKLVDSSAKIRAEIASAGGLQTHKPYVPTDWTKEDDTILDGWDESKGSCSKCNTLRSLNGACAC